MYRVLQFLCIRAGRVQFYHVVSDCTNISLPLAAASCCPETAAVHLSERDCSVGGVGAAAAAARIAECNSACCSQMYLACACPKSDSGAVFLLYRSKFDSAASASVGRVTSNAWGIDVDIADNDLANAHAREHDNPRLQGEFSTEAVEVVAQKMGMCWPESSVRGVHALGLVGSIASFCNTFCLWTGPWSICGMFSIQLQHSSRMAFTSHRPGVATAAGCVMLFLAAGWCKFCRLLRLWSQRMPSEPFLLRAGRKPCWQKATAQDTKSRCSTGTRRAIRLHAEAFEIGPCARNQET